jgi:hypothetical protein
MMVTISHRLLLHRAVPGLLQEPIIDPRTGRALKHPLVVLGQVAELPRIDENIDSESFMSDDTTGEDGASAARTPRRRTEASGPTPQWHKDVRAFVRGGGAAIVEPSDAPATVAELLRVGAREARLPPLDRLMAARSEHVFAGWVQATALGETQRAVELATELERRMAPEAKGYSFAVRQIFPA